MSRGLLDHLEQAVHISEGMNIPFAEAQEIVAAAYAALDPNFETPPTTIDNIVYGVDFGRKKPKGVSYGTL
jgi:hypothetical protein